jgi:hypothetical protein
MASTGSGLAKNLDKIGAVRGFFPRVPVGHLFFHPEGHDFEHPRARLPVDEGLRDSILKEGFREDEPIVIWRQVAKGGEVTLNGTVLERGDALLLVAKGCRRGHAAFATERELRKQGKLRKSEPFLVPTRDWLPVEGEGPAEAQFFLMMQEDDSRPYKKDHSPSVVASLLIRACKWGASLADAQARAPRGYDDRTVEFLLRWPELPAKVAKAFDEGVMTVKVDGEEKEKKVNINLLPTLLDPDGLVPRDEMLSILKSIVAAGKTHWKGASRWLREQATVEKVTRGRKAAATEAAQDEPETQTESTSTNANAGSRGGESETKASPRPPSGSRRAEDLPVLVQQPSPKKRKELVETLRGRASAEGGSERYALVCFAAGVAFSLGEDVQTVHELPDAALEAIREVFTKKAKRASTGGGEGAQAE